MTTMNIYDMADTWNNAGTTFTAIKMNVTDTASGVNSLLLDLQVGGSSKFRVAKWGEPTISTVNMWGATYRIVNESDAADWVKIGKWGTKRFGFFTADGPNIGGNIQPLFTMAWGGTGVALLETPQATNRMMLQNLQGAIVLLAGTGHYEFETSGASIDIVGYKAASAEGRMIAFSNVGQTTRATPLGVWANDASVDLMRWHQGASIDESTLKLAVDQSGGLLSYNTNDASSENYERVFMRWNSNVFEIGSEADGTGTARPVALTASDLRMTNLPTQDPQVAGQLWNDNGTLMISSGA